MAAALTALILVTGTAWSVRSLGIHQAARTYAFKTRNDWASQPGNWKRSGRWPADARSQRLIIAASQRRAVDAHAQPVLRAAMDRASVGRLTMSRRMLLVAIVPAAVLAVARVVFLVLAAWGLHPFWMWEPLNLAEAAALRDRGEVARLLAEGEDPNATYRVRRGFVANAPCG